MMKKNNSLRELSDKLKSVKNILVYPHINGDGDTLGSSVALCIALRKLGKECFVLLEEKIPSNLSFLDKGYCTEDENVLQNVDLSICVDCGDLTRLEKRKQKFISGASTMCIDHHSTSEPFCDLNFIDSRAAATGEIIFHLIKELKISGDSEIGEALFAAITTDTGNFQYSNTTKVTHEIAGALYDWNIDANKVSRYLYENVRFEKLKIKNLALSTMEIFADGKVAMAYVTQKMLDESSALMEETDGVVEDLRSIKGVEIAVFLKEVSGEKVKVSLRSKYNADVSVIAKIFGGGGHSKASGFTICKNISDSCQEIKKEILKNLGNL
ncbi:MAG: bifunctional oligoribonuclease/PAP phosphatase NrnA [Eubacteriales bacterium]|nr:bifunctional oligoribonuclease/PAP phosphatase NrnA [Eubacteriales bacterium]